MMWDIQPTLLRYEAERDGCTCSWWGVNHIVDFDITCPVLHKHKGFTLPEETNPKAARAIADGKAPLRFLQPAANAPTSRVLRHGAEKYGYRNWRIDRIHLPTYLEAVQRHLDAMKEGEWLDPDSGEPHWAHIGANVHVVLDADQFGTLDREMEPESKPLSKRVHVDGDFDAKGEKPTDELSRIGM